MALQRPIGISGGLNQYVFCGDNPVNARDPFGLTIQLVGTREEQQPVLRHLNMFVHAGGVGLGIDDNGFISREPPENPHNDECIEQDVDRLIASKNLYRIHAYSKADFGHFDPVGKIPGLTAQYWGTGKGGDIFYEPTGGQPYNLNRSTMTGAQILAHELLGRALNDLDEIEAGAPRSRQRTEDNNRAVQSADRAWVRMHFVPRGVYN